jgi:hypothetical protein
MAQMITHLQAKSDSNMFVDMIKCIKDLKNMNWQVQINHIWREGNKSAD